MNRHLVVYTNPRQVALELPQLREVHFGLMILLNPELFLERVAPVLHDAELLPDWQVQCDNLGGPPCL